MMRRCWRPPWKAPWCTRAAGFSRGGTVEIEPEVSYSYDKPIRGQRRDNFGAALTARFGLPWAMQAEMRVRYTVPDRWTEVGTSSGIGDIRLSLTKKMVTEREWVPALLAFAQWRTTTGDINSSPSTGLVRTLCNSDRTQ